MGRGTSGRALGQLALLCGQFSDFVVSLVVRGRRAGCRLGARYGRYRHRVQLGDPGGIRRFRLTDVHGRVVDDLIA